MAARSQLGECFGGGGGGGVCGGREGSGLEMEVGR